MMYLFPTRVALEFFFLATDATQNKRAIIAGWIDGVRLIDNMRMGA